MSDTFARLAEVLEERKNAAPDSSYVASLYHKGLNKILEKVGEEAVETILAAADEIGADLIVMGTQGSQGFLDALRGSTTEQVLRRSLSPLLAVPERRRFKR